MGHVLAPTVVAAGVLPAAFESAFLIRCASPARLPGRRAACVSRAARPAGLIEFDREDAAVRLMTLLDGLGFQPRHEVRDGGGQRRYRVHQVTVPGEVQPMVNRTMGAAWRQGRSTLLDTGTVGMSSPRHAQRGMLAKAAWRAALLACHRRRFMDPPGVHLGDHETAALLIRTARLLGVTVVMTRRPGCLLVTIPVADAAALLALRAPEEPPVR
ncbi:MAG TPA: hypothetical protein VN408_19865 [Actinoplanes sp.]|nr:hypothetical protein [Actinoplanes sp.]